MTVIGSLICRIKFISIASAAHCLTVLPYFSSVLSTLPSFLSILTSVCQRLHRDPAQTTHLYRIVKKGYTGALVPTLLLLSGCAVCW